LEKSVIKGSEWLALLLAAAAIITQSFVPPIVGIANNGDFPKIIGQFDVGSPSDAKDSFRFVDTKYVVDSRYHYESRFYSSEVFLFEAALGLNSVFGRPGVLDLRLMGAVHAALFLLAFYLFLPLVRLLSMALRLVVFFVVLLIFTDVMYVSYFNSFYMDTAALLFLLLSVVSSCGRFSGKGWQIDGCSWLRPHFWWLPRRRTIRWEFPLRCCSHGRVAC